MVRITGIGWRLKFYFFLDFVVPINSMLQHTSPPPSLPRALDYSLCPRSRHLKKKAFSRVGYLNVTRVRQGIWTRIVKSFQWNKISFFFFWRGIWEFEQTNLQKFKHPVGLPREGGMMLKLCTDWHILLKGTQRKLS